MLADLKMLAVAFVAAAVLISAVVVFC